MRQEFCNTKYFGLFPRTMRKKSSDFNQFSGGCDSIIFVSREQNSCYSLKNTWKRGQSGHQETQPGDIAVVWMSENSSLNSGEAGWGQSSR